MKAGDFVTPTVRLVRPLAEGGMGRVWIAEHLGLHAQVVVKLMAPEMTARPDGAERFAREAAAAAAIKSPHVVQVFDHGVTANAIPYIVMELLEGKDLGAHLAEHERMTPAEVATVIVQVGRALSKAHKASIIHRDIKPDNIFLCDTEGGEGMLVKLLDFGTAKHETSSHAQTTIPGLVMGTPYYMSPEQSIGAEDIDERSDIWSLGVVAFEALTGRRPFDGPSVGAITMSIHGDLPRLTEVAPELPPALEAWFARACAHQPRDRFGSAREAADAFVEAATGSAPVDQPTESIFFPAIKAKGGSTPVRPVTRAIPPLIDSLPERGSERKFTTIAAGGVMLVAAVAMIAIVAGRSPGPAPDPAQAQAQASTPQAPASTAPPLPEPPTAEPQPEAKTEAKTEAKPEAKAETPPPAPHADTRPKTAKSAQRSGRAAPKADAGAAPAPAPTPGPDDDLARLSKAAAKHAAEQPPAPPASAPAPTAPASSGNAPLPSLPPDP